MKFPAATPLFLAALSAGAWAQTPDTGYTPPAPPLLITPSPSQNPYLIYLPAPQPIPAAPVQIVPVLPPVIAPPPPAGPTLSELGKSLRSYFTQEELDLLMDYMKQSVVAAFKGEEVYLPPDLAFKLEVLLARMKKEGTRYMDNLMKQLEADLKRSLKEKLTPPGAEPEPQPKTEPAAMPVPPASRLPAKKGAKTG